MNFKYIIAKGKKAILNITTLIFIVIGSKTLHDAAAVLWSVK